MKAGKRIGLAATASLLLATAVTYSAELMTLQVEQPPDLLLPPESRRGMFKLGMFDIIPQLAVGMTYDNNIFATSVNTVSDYIWTIAPGITAIASDPQDGKKFLLSYVPSFVFYTKNPEENTVGQSVRVSSLLPLARLTLGLDGTVNIEQSAVVGTGQLVQTRSYTAAATSKYEVGAKTSVEVNGKMFFENGESLIGNSTWGNNDWINYSLSDRLTMGLGVTFNYVTVENAPNQTYEQALVRAAYSFSEKLVLNVTVGPEWRQYGGGAPDTLSPAVGIGASYRILRNTTLNLTAAETIQTSLDLTGQNYYGKNIHLYIVQKLTDKLSLSIGGGYEHDRYYSVVSGVPPDQATDLYTAGTGLSYQILERWTAGIFYNYRQNTGNASVNRFNDNQAGIQTSWTY